MLWHHLGYCWTTHVAEKKTSLNNRRLE